MLADRRRKRSCFRALSLHYWLSAVAERRRGLALVLADKGGLLVASSIRGPEAEELAAVVPFLSGESDDGDIPERAKRIGVPLVVDEVDVNGTPLLLCAVGDRPSGTQALRQAASGIRRILASQVSLQPAL